MRMSTKDAPICVILGTISALSVPVVSTITRASHAIALAHTTRVNTATSTVSSIYIYIYIHVCMSICVVRHCRREGADCCLAWQRHFVLIINYVCLLAVSQWLQHPIFLPLSLSPSLSLSASSLRLLPAVLNTLMT